MTNSSKNFSEVDDILENLSNVLSTKRGVGSFLRNFGLTETGYRTQNEMLNTLTRELRENILLFEPRVEIVEIDEDFDDETGRSSLSVELVVKATGQPLHFAMDSKLKKLQLAPDSVDDDELE
ncbi:MAG: GPW/gp25 family protein [Myxococcota bacterium]|nr:GPW/gp25 family protein [Myxococcota bacterium]